MSLTANGLNDVVGNAAGLADDGHGLEIDALDEGHAGHADDDRPLAGGHGAAGHAGTAAAGNEGELEVVGEPNEGRHLLCGIGLDHGQGKLHAQIRGVGLGGHEGGGIGKNALKG